MRYELMVRSRAREDEGIASKHARLTTALRELPKPWGFDGLEGPTAPHAGGELIASVGLTQHLGPGIRGEIVYQFRRAFRDEGAADDFLALSFNPERVDLAGLSADVFSRYVAAFDAYRGEVGHAEFTHKDFDASRQIDFRQGVFRIYPVCFFDRLLCQRAFGIEPEDVASRLAPLCEQCRLENGGVTVMASSRPLPLKEADQISHKLKDALGRSS